MGKNNDDKKRGCFGTIIVLILSVLALLGLLSMSLCVLSSYINPQHFAWTALFGLAFWGILLFNMVILVLMIFLRSRTICITILALLVAISGFTKSFAFGKGAEAEQTLKVMTYNVHNFKHIEGKMEPDVMAADVMELVKKQNPDVLCCQEFSTFQKGLTRPQSIELFRKEIGANYVYYNMKRNYAGNVIFSKYPLQKVAEDSGFGEENTYGTMALVDAGEKGKFYVACVHLLSYKITDDEIDVLVDTRQRQDSLEVLGKSLARKLKGAFELRSDQIQTVLDALPEVKYPLILCGDFNETPVSYVYSKMKRAGFVDTFVKVGRGIKPTYAGRLPLLRIDYIWSKNDVKPLNIKRIRHKVSDHYPLVLEFSLENNQQTE
ncbi:MAG: endonuclease/exonuclease/phosphatase family protein [Bacteroidales bacterium]|nr:endonuclease/exonuclease/phosphatase family protein [Bacteroidales bacterium]